VTVIDFFRYLLGCDATHDLAVQLVEVCTERAEARCEHVARAA
jgi:hypothetical protein